MTRTGVRPRPRAFRAVVALAAALVVILVGILAGLLYWIWHPEADVPDRADAIVVLAYGRDRLREGRELAEEGVSDQLVISFSTRMRQRVADGDLQVLSPEEIAEDGPPTSPWVEECNADYGEYSTTCIYPDPNTTEGEAAAVSSLMEANSWNSVVVVTERSHLNRALYIFDRCTPGDEYGAMSDRVGPWYRDLWRSTYEVAALGKLVVNGACVDRE